jgi:streptogramin lyase
MITIQIVGGGLIAPCGVAIDAGGNAWAYDCQRSVVARFSSLGAMLSGDQGYSTGIANASSIAIDRSGNAWIASSSSSTDNVIELSPSGVPSSWSPYSQSGLYGHLAIDGLGDAWLANYSNPSVTEISSSGSILSGTSGYTGGGLDQSAGVAVDGSGSVWITNQGNGSVTKLSNSGAILSGANGFTSTFNGRQGIAIDSSGNAWVAIYAGVLELSNTGTVLSGANGYQSFPYEGFSAVALDGSGNAWVGSSDTGYGSLAEFSNSGTLLSGASGYTGDSNLRTYFFYPAAVAIDGSGDVWAANSYGGVDEFIGAATPVITPIMAGLPPTPTSNGSSNLATRP